MQQPASSPFVDGKQGVYSEAPQQQMQMQQMLQAIEQLTLDRDRTEEAMREQLEAMEALKLENSGLRNAFTTTPSDGPLPERNKEAPRPPHAQPRDIRELQQAAALFREPSSSHSSQSASASTLEILAAL